MNIASRSSRAGFTLVELIIFSAIFSLVTVSFLSILVAVVRVQARQGASNDVNQQSDFILATVQRLVEQASHIEGTAGVEATSVTLRMPSASEDPTRLYVSGGIVYLEVAGGQAQALTTDQVAVTDAAFVKRSNAGGKDGLAMSMTVSNNTGSSTRAVARLLDVFVSRVSAATFDADVVPSTGNTYKLGVNAQPWQSINELMYFSSGNVGVGVSSPASKLEVNGGVRLNTGTSKPTCASGIRGTLWITQAGSGSADVVEACLRNASSTYNWVAL